MIGQPSALVIDRSRAKSWRATNGGSILTPFGLHTVVVSDRDGPHYRNLDPTTITLCLVDRIDAANIVDVLDKRGVAVVGVSTTSELFLETAAAIRSSFGLPGHQPDYVTRVRDKWLMKLLARGGAIPHARGLLGTNVLLGGSLPPAEKYMVKPRDQSGARGTAELSTGGAVRQFLEAARDEAEGLLVEEFINGTVVHIDGFVTGGSTSYLLSAYERAPHRSGGRKPLSSYTVDDAELKTMAGDFINSVVEVWALHDDVFHCEAFLVEGSLVFCELAGRPGGAGVSEVFDVVRGADLRWTKTLLDLGLDPRSAPSRLGLSYQAAGWTVLYETPSAMADDHASGVVLVHADIRPAGQERVVGHTGVGAATLVFGGDDTSGVRRCLASFEPTSDPLHGGDDER